jgi:predicted TIM-barrel fold metal-dependent hydrolase
VKRRPSEYVREHFRFTTAPAHLPGDPVALDQLLEMMGGAGNLVYASDYPHEHGDGLPALLDRLSEEQRHDVMCGTAANLYGLTD